MPAARPTRRRASLAPRREKRGLDAAQITLAPDAPEFAPLSAEVRAAGGAPIGAYREPLSGRALLLAALPVAAVEPTPFQRDLSPTHTKRLAQKIDEAGAFLELIMPIAAALTRMAAAARRFDPKSVKAGDLALVAALAPEG
jgi:ParB family transcriptional regulator, chromosome partitioning protein